MKIVLVSMNFAPELTGIGKYSGELADGLVARGHQVKVVCAPPYYPSWKVESGYSAGRYCTERPTPGLTVYRCPVWIPKRLSGLNRLIHLASFAISSFPLMLWLVLWRPAIVFTVVPALFCAPGAWLMARLAGAKAWLHVQDFEVDAAFNLGLLKQPLLRKCALFAEKVLLQRFDAVSTISSRMLRQLATKGIPLQHTETLPNWVDLSLIKPSPGSQDLRSTLGISSTQLVCLFSGTINRKQGLGVLVETAKLLQHDPEVMFVICGNGELRESLELSAEGLGNVKFLDLQPMSEFNQLLNMADIHLLPQLRDAADLVMPSKLVGMLASGRPVIAAAMPGTEIATIVSRSGIVTEPECAEGFARAIATLGADADMRQRFGAAGRSYAERVLDSSKIFDRLALRFESLSRRRDAAVVSAANARRSKALSMAGGRESGTAGDAAGIANPAH